MDGFLNLNKPAGFTSHDCVAKVRRLLKLKRVGHGGTLDPAATGVLPIALGRATRLLQFLPGDKAYRATIRFGVKTTTDDLEGEILTAAPAPTLTLEQVKQALPQFQGKIQQIPPSYSAIQVQGRRLYELARSGEAVEAPIRTVEVFQMDVLDWRPGDFPELEVAIACGAGTYIRAIARDLGDLLNTGGTLASLIRTTSSSFHLSDSLTLDHLTEQVQQETFRPIVPELALEHLPVVSLSASEGKRWRQGQRIRLEQPGLSSIKACRVHQDSLFLGIGQLVEPEDIQPESIQAEDIQANPDQGEDSALKTGLILSAQVVLVPEG